jgi:hypothetical protein
MKHVLPRLDSPHTPGSALGSCEQKAAEWLRVRKIEWPFFFLDSF